jgi:hypothetical protein
VPVTLIRDAQTLRRMGRHQTMTKQEQERIDRQFARAEREAEKTAATILRLVDRLLDKTTGLDCIVAPDTVRHFLLMALVDRGFAEQVVDTFGPAGSARAMRLSNALYDYRDGVGV